MTLRSLMVASCALALISCGPEISAPEPGDTAPVWQTDLHADWAFKSLPELSDALAAGEITSVELTQIYLDRIAALDADGPRLQAVLTLNPDALDQAAEIDRRRAAGEALPPLAGIPILLKDNIETADNMPTTAGALALKDNLTRRDSPLVAGLRADGAIILGKTNLSQWANFRSRDSISGWSALGGQVRNPHMLDRSPCGSSSGSGAAVAASLAAGTVGTETNGSIICPSNVNGIVGFKPTVGLVPQGYIVPISVSQDTAGPMTKTVRGAAMMLSSMDGAGGPDYAAALDDRSLAGTRIGVMRFAEGSNADIIALFNAAIADLEAAGAEIVEIEDFSPEADNFWGKSFDVLTFEFKDGLNAYLAGSPADIPVRSLAELIAFNNDNADLELALFDQSLFDASDAKETLESEDYITAVTDVKRAAGEQGIDALMAFYEVDVLISPSGPVASRVDPINGDVWPDWAGAGYLAAIAGYPHLTVPMGDVHGVPVGLSFMAGAGDDADVLSYGYAYEQTTNHRKDPAYLRTAEDRPEVKAAMERE